MMEMILCAGAAVGVIGAVAGVPELMFRYKIKKGGNVPVYKKPPMEDMYNILEKMSHPNIKWRRSSQEELQYECEVESYRIHITAYPERNTIKLSIQEKGILWYEISVHENYLMAVYVKECEEDGTLSEEQRTITLYGMWILNMKKRLQEEEERRKKEMERLKLDWGKRKKEQEENYHAIIQNFTKVNLLKVLGGREVCKQNSHFILHVKREHNHIECELQFQNGMVLFRGRLSMEGVWTEEKRLPYIKGEKEEKLFAVLKQHTTFMQINPTSQLHEKTETKEKTIEMKVEIEKEIAEKIEYIDTCIKKIKLEKEWLTDEEVFWLEEIAQKDIYEPLYLYVSVSENKKEEAKQICLETLCIIQRKVEEFLTHVDNQKIKELQKRLRIVEKRGDYCD